jgi:hypothetical protein
VHQFTQHNDNNNNSNQKTSKILSVVVTFQALTLGIVEVLLDSEILDCFFCTGSLSEIRLAQQDKLIMDSGLSGTRHQLSV